MFLGNCGRTVQFSGGEIVATISTDEGLSTRVILSPHISLVAALYVGLFSSTTLSQIITDGQYLDLSFVHTDGQYLDMELCT